MLNDTNQESLNSYLQETKNLRLENVDLKAQRDEAVENANNQKARMIDLCKSMMKQEEGTMKSERKHGLDPVYREQYIRALESIVKTLENYNYAKEAELAGSLAAMKAEE